MRHRQVPSPLLRGEVTRVPILTFVLLLPLAGCDDSSPVKELSPSPTGTNALDGGPPVGSDGGSLNGKDGGPSDCVTNPKTHAEIINACTNATKITKNPTLPKLLADGGLPPLQ